MGEKGGRLDYNMGNWSDIRVGGLFVVAGLKTLLEQDLAGSKKPCIVRGAANEGNVRRMAARNAHPDPNRVP